MRLAERVRLVRFETAMLPHLDSAHNMARWLLGNDQDAEDAVQESYLRALTYFDSFHGEDGRAWLLAIVRHTCYAQLRRKNRHHAEALEADSDLETAEERSPDPEALALRNAARDEVARALEQLPPEFREALVLREMEGMSYKQIARIADVPVGTVMSRLARARKRLHETLAGKVRKEIV
jgi:RNA polymerase sigma-70 factor, ECF subfamily